MRFHSLLAAALLVGMIPAWAWFAPSSATARAETASSHLRRGDAVVAPRGGNLPRPNDAERFRIDDAATESVKPADPHGFRLAASLSTMRASPSGAKLLALLHRASDHFKVQIGASLAAEADWLLVYGPRVAFPGPNACVVKHHLPERVLATLIAERGFEPWDVGPPAVGGSSGATSGDLYGAREVLLRPQPGLLAFVPAGRAREFVPVLARALETGLKPDELARVFVAQPWKVAGALAADFAGVTLSVTASPDGGLDVSAHATCAKPSSCAEAVTTLAGAVRRANTFLVRLATGNVLGGLALHTANGKATATLHATPEQVDASLSAIDAALDPSTAGQSPEP